MGKLDLTDLSNRMTWLLSTGGFVLGWVNGV